MLGADLILIVGVIAVERIGGAVLNGRVVLDGRPLLGLLLRQLHVESLLLLVLLPLGGEGPPGEFDRDRALIHDFVVLMGVQGD